MSEISNVATLETSPLLLTSYGERSDSDLFASDTHSHDIDDSQVVIDITPKKSCLRKAASPKKDIQVKWVDTDNVAPSPLHVEHTVPHWDRKGKMFSSAFSNPIYSENPQSDSESDSEEEVYISKRQCVLLLLLVLFVAIIVVGFVVCLAIHAVWYNDSNFSL
eukprot:TRINITY_DN11777_c0_g1_i1.p1 TRINITY_DN11777_c0_g1~~TRINITY_DN11777_c0_g1_i1.p1  ORF type:complete len:163 (-),score=22.90 TRINITY_DN11777_c0_g1_i1:132-620(-)